MRTPELFLVLVLALIASACQQPQAESFQSWYEHHLSEAQFQTKHSFAKGEMHLRSKVFKIDTIFRSMQGPFETQEVEIEGDDDAIVWLKGYSARVLEAGSNARLSDGFMCHNNLNIAQKEDLPWKVKTLGTSVRLFTLTEGQTSVRLPEGYGIPIPAGSKVNAISQVLNHNLPNADFDVYQDITIDYVTEAHDSAAMKPLYQQAVFVTKQMAGPAGGLGEVPYCGVAGHDSTSREGKAPNHQCAIEYSEEAYNPYRDQQGRTFTGHWEIPTGIEVLETDITRMLNLPYNTTVHYIGVHLHPFAQSLALWDATTDTMLYQANAKGYPTGIGIEQIDHYSSEKGFEVFANHSYKLVSTYECSDSTERHTAMATMFLYLHDKR